MNIILYGILTLTLCGGDAFIWYQELSGQYMEVMIK